MLCDAVMLSCCDSVRDAERCYKRGVQDVQELAHDGHTHEVVQSLVSTGGTTM
jgi:hypothetical protein